MSLFNKYSYNSDGTLKINGIINISTIDILKDKYFILFLIFGISSYILNIILFNQLKICKSNKETTSLLFKFDTFIKFIIYICFIYLLSYYSNIMNNTINNMLFYFITIIVILLSNILNLSLENIFNKNTHIDTQMTLINIIKISGLSILIILFFGYNIYNVYNDNDTYVYWGKLFIIIVIIGIYILLNILEGTIINNCNKIKISILQKLDIKLYFITFILMLLIYKDNYYISVICFSILFGIFINSVSILGIESNIIDIPI